MKRHTTVRQVRQDSQSTARKQQVGGTKVQSCPSDSKTEPRYTLTVNVLDFSGAPVPAAQVSVKSTSGDKIIATGTTNEHGSATLQVQQGSYRVEASKTGLERLHSEDWSTPVVVSDDTSTVSRRIGQCLLTVMVKDLHDQPIPEANVHVYDASGTKLEASQTANPEGRAVIPLKAGTYKVKVNKQHYIDPPPNQNKSGEPVVVTDDTATATRIIAGIAWVEFQVRELLHPSPRALPGATIKVDGKLKTSEQKVDGHGQHKARVAAGFEHTLTASLRGNKEPAQQTVNLQVGETRKVNLDLSFPKIFIVGEGERFDYAIKLANRYDGNSNDRKWIIASQYDVTNLPGSAPDNLLAYEDEILTNGQFDCTQEDCWRRAATALQPDFEACIFNNPHAGHQLSRYDVIGVVQGFFAHGHWKNKSIDATEYNDLGDIADFTSGSLENLSKDEVFELDTSNNRYKVKRPTMGLNEHLLRQYAAFGKAHINPCTLDVNGPAWVDDYLPKYGLSKVGPFTGSPYYVNYTSNLTSVSPHPSWGTNTRHHSSPDKMSRWTK